MGFYVIKWEWERRETDTIDGNSFMFIRFYFSFFRRKYVRVCVDLFHLWNNLNSYTFIFILN